MVKTYSINLAQLRYHRDVEGCRDYLVEILRKGDVDASTQREIADMLDPKVKGGVFKLELKHTRGNQTQHNDAWWERLDAFEAIYNSSPNEKEAIERAAMPVKEGGLGVSTTAVRNLLAHLKAHRQAQEDCE